MADPAVEAYRFASQRAAVAVRRSIASRRVLYEAAYRRRWKTVKPPASPLDDNQQENPRKPKSGAVNSKRQ